MAESAKGRTHHAEWDSQLNYGRDGTEPSQELLSTNSHIGGVAKTTGQTKLLHSDNLNKVARELEADKEVRVRVEEFRRRHGTPSSDDLSKIYTI